MITTTDQTTIRVQRMARDWGEYQFAFEFWYKGLKVTSCFGDGGTFTLFFADGSCVSGVEYWEDVALVAIGDSYGES